MAEPVQEGTEVLPASVSLKEEEEKSPCKEEEEEDEEDLPHAEFLDIFEEGLARIVQDPLLCDLPIQVTLEEINSQVALEYGQAMTVRVCKDDGEVMPIVVVQNATVLDLKKAIRRFMELKQQREGGVKHISWRYVWRTFHLIFDGEKLEDDKMKLKDYGIRNRDEVTFLKKLKKWISISRTGVFPQPEAKAKGEDLQPPTIPEEKDLTPVYNASGSSEHEQSDQGSLHV